MNPPAPTKAQIEAAARRVSARAAALQIEQDRLGVQNARLAKLTNQAESLSELYDQAVAAEQEAGAAYLVATARLAGADAAQRQAHDLVAAQAAADYERFSGAGRMAAMLTSPHGPQSYLGAFSLEELMAQHDAEVFGARQASAVVATVFRQQVVNLLEARQADVRTADRLKVAVEAAVAQQLAAVQATRSARNRLAGQLAAARARQQALAAAAAASDVGSDRVSAGQVGTDRWAAGSGASATLGDQAANWALSQLGKPYQWGGAGPGAYDCSGLTMRAWQHAGILLGHWTGWQWVAGPHVALDELQRGDLLFYATDIADPATIHHVGIYIGNGMMVDAPYTGAYVRIDSIYDSGLIGATRPAAA